MRRYVLTTDEVGEARTIGDATHSLPDLARAKWVAIEVVTNDALELAIDAFIEVVIAEKPWTGLHDLDPQEIARFRAKAIVRTNDQIES